MMAAARVVTRVSCHAVALLVCAATFASAQSLHVGMNTRVLTPPMADKMVELGAGLVRLPFGWDLLEPACKGCYDWTTTDAWRDEAKRTHRTIFASLAYAPAWANGGHDYTYPPINYQDWYDFVFAAVSRYRDDIFLWGVWNEPDLDVFLHGTDVNVYRALTINARSAILRANPDARVIGPDVSWHALTSGWFAAAMTSFGDLFDIVTVHWYIDAPPIGEMMDTKVRPYALGKPIWLGEAGRKPCASLFGEAGQALFYAQVLDAFQARREWWTAVLFYDLWEEPTPPDCGSAITRPDWSNRPAFTVLQNFIRAHP
jgi:hypothetical protein